ncbi:MAG: YcdB/YcdC domain-containing protein, partial [Bacillota bacterium]
MSHRQRQMLAAVFALVLTVTLTTPVLATPEPAMPAKQEPAHAVVNPSDPAAAQLKVTEKVAIEKALQTFAIPNDLGKPNVNLWTDSGKYGQGPTWNLSWERDPRLGGTRISYSVGINAQSGEIVSYSVYQSDPNGQQPKIKYTRDEAQKFADEWYAKLIPIDKTTEPQNNPQYANSDLNYTWVRVENGVPFPDNVISININPSDGSLSNFYRNWDENLTFPAVQGVVSAETAQAAYTKTGSPELIYQRFHTPAGRSQVKLVYVSKAQNANIDALTGQLVDYNGEAWIGNGSPIDLGKSDAKLVKLEKQMTREEALALARQYLGEDAKAEPTYTSYHAPGQPADKYGDESIRYSAWAFNWDIQGKEANQNRYLSATVDIDHGVLMNFNSYDGYVADEQLRAKTPVAEQAARATAIEFVKRVRPDLINELLITDRAVTEKYRDWPADRPTPIQREYYFNFRRMVNGLRFDSDNLSVSVDRFSGQVRNFYRNWDENLTFPPVQGVVSAETSQAAYTKKGSPELIYQRFHTPAGRSHV